MSGTALRAVCALLVAVAVGGCAAQPPSTRVDDMVILVDVAVDGEALGRSRGRLTSKIHLAVDGRGLPMSILLTPGQAGDNPQLLPLLDQIAVGRDGPGRPRKRSHAQPCAATRGHTRSRAVTRGHTLRRHRRGCDAVTFNSVVLRKYDDTRLSLPGVAATFAPRPHQVAAVARMIKERSGCSARSAPERLVGGTPESGVPPAAGACRQLTGRV